MAVDVIVGDDVPLSEVYERAPSLLESSTTSAKAVRALVDRAAALYAEERVAQAEAVVRLVASYAIPGRSATKALLDLASHVDTAAICVVENIASVCDPDNADFVVDRLQDMLQSDRSLLVPILAALAALPLPQDTRSEATVLARDALAIVDQNDLPAVVRALLLPAANKTAMSQIIASIRRHTSDVDNELLFPLLQIIVAQCKSFHAIAKGFLSQIAAAKSPSPLDLLTIIALLGHRQSRQAAFDALRASLSATNMKSMDGILHLLDTCSQTCESYGSCLLTLSRLLLHSPPVTTDKAEGACTLLKAIIVHMTTVRDDALRLLLSSVSTSSSQVASCAAAHSLLLLAESDAFLLHPFSQHLLDALHHSEHLLPAVLHDLAETVALTIATNPSLVTSCILFCQKTIFSGIDVHVRTGLVLASHLLASADLPTADRDDLMIWVLRIDAERNSQSSSVWFLDLLYNVARTLSLDEAQHILSVHLLPQVQPLFIDGKLGDLQDDDLLNAILLWHSTSVVAHRCAVPFPSQSLHDLIEAFDGDLSPCQSVLALFILCSHVAGIELNDDALVVKRCIDLLEATGDISSPVTTRALPLPLDCVLRSLKSSSNGLSPHHLVVLLRRLSRGLESKEPAKVSVLSMFIDRLDVVFCPAMRSSRSPACQPVLDADMMSWLTSALLGWHETPRSDDCRPLALALHIVGITVHSDNIDPQRLSSLYESYLSLFESCGESTCALLAMNVIHRLTAGRQQSRAVGKLCLETAMRKVFQCMDAGASHLDVLRPIKVSECAKSCFLSPATCTSLFRASREAILSQVVSKRVPPDAASFMHLYWAALALAPSRAIFPSLIELVDGLSNLAADASVRCHRSIPSITQTTLPALTEFALRISLAATFRADHRRRSRGDLCETLEALAVVCRIISTCASAVTVAALNRTLSVLPSLIDHCVDVCSSTRSSIPKSSLAPVLAASVAINDAIRRIAVSMRTSQSRKKGRVRPVRALPTLYRRLEESEAHTAATVERLSFEVGEFDADAVIDAFMRSLRQDVDGEQSDDAETNGVDLGHSECDEVLIDDAAGDEDDDKFMQRFYQDSGDDDDDDAEGEDRSCYSGASSRKRSAPE
ncbi:hypothetical protein PBRA_007826 [Plasmodiophora brassicae]|uniref:Uncharacterized protein n=1 Tax=Plasmodiophora brassicae TaxID=37360 RepID=A0A0G4IXU8_PLABS|nr:hypothetical protein PBRA_007826 [Plasmodiophora brassicae]